MDGELRSSRFAAARVAHLATVAPDGSPHVVPCCFALDGDSIVSAVDAKPKSTLALRRLVNVRTNPAVTIMVDHYDDDWSQLWWIRVDGRASVVDDGPLHRSALARLAEKYRQYREALPPGAVLVIEPTVWRAWP